MKRSLLTFVFLVMLLLCGCAVVPTDTGWPKPTWYWSYAAEEHRSEKEIRNAHYGDTNLWGVVPGPSKFQTQ